MRLTRVAKAIEVMTIAPPRADNRGTRGGNTVMATAGILVVADVISCRREQPSVLGFSK